jgi:sterol desaturase/sphingolipid hydroxylase (fatty acid hydroxylase superfamily)
VRLSRAGYYSDFVAYPLIILTLATVALSSPDSIALLKWLTACAVGIVGWTLAEYCIHRFVFHRVPVFARMHHMHHATPGALIGAPLWSSLSAFGFGVFIPLWWQAGLDIAGGVTIGLMFGYLWYMLVHTAIHRWRLDRSSLLYQAKLRHMRHHQAREEGNFGVTTSLWDRLLGTKIEC